MSSDNYMYVYPVAFQHVDTPQATDLYAVVMRFDSAEYGSDMEEWHGNERAKAQRFLKLSEAIDHAHREASGESNPLGIGTEYGVVYSTQLQLPSYSDLIRVWEENPAVRLAIWSLLESRKISSYHMRTADSEADAGEAPTGTQEALGRPESEANDATRPMPVQAPQEP